MRRLEVRLDWGDEQVPVGALAEQDRRVYFEYDPAFLAAPLPISPFKLPVRPGLFEHEERDFASVFGVFNDSLPDGWGLLLMDRAFMSAAWTRQRFPSWIAWRTSARGGWARSPIIP